MACDKNGNIIRKKISFCVRTSCISLDYPIHTMAASNAFQIVPVLSAMALMTCAVLATNGEADSKDKSLLSIFKYVTQYM